MSDIHLHAFTGLGIELEYMIVDRDSLELRPIADELLRAEDGSFRNDVERGHFDWSNELVMHLVEIKNNDPTEPLAVLRAGFNAEVAEVNHRLARLGAQLMPGGMHPWMDPRAETRLWPHDYAAIYRGYDRIFDCRRHGWANLQSMHVNLPFSGDEEFARLHAAVRLLLPLLPALAAASPIAEGVPTGFLDFRMECYLSHTAAVPSLLGPVIPEPVGSQADYREHILEPMYREIAPLDPQGELRGEWLNARAAIARFDRSALEIRVIDTQECSWANLAIAAAVRAVLRHCYQSDAMQQELTVPMDTRALLRLLRACARGAGPSIISDRDYLSRLGFAGSRCTAHDLWQHLLEQSLFRDAEDSATWREPLQLILDEGTLARRILRAIGTDYRRQSLRDVHARLCRCLARDSLFRP